MAKNVNINITKTNIKNGERANPGKCPIANSLKENVKGIVSVHVLPDSIHLVVKENKEHVGYTTKTPYTGNQFIKKFDDGKRVTPFKLELNFTKTNLLAI